MTPEPLSALIDATWPPASTHSVGPWIIREGAGGGSRVSAATDRVPGTATEADIADAEAAMAGLGQPRLFMVREGEEALDSALETRGYKIKDPVTTYLANVQTLATDRPAAVSVFEVHARLAIQDEIWAEGGIGPDRLSIMERVTGPAVTILGRIDDRPAGTLFAACHDNIVMLHAIETRAAFRRRGVGRNMLRAAAFWARDIGARSVALLVTTANEGANTLYASLGMQAAAGYHYRIKDFHHD